jgi:glutamyl-tRNA synthetase/nondiscriminating glutamyl-tRNA synthetase
MRLRFAPSPTGHLHVGNARTALFNWLLARGRHATFILRIEDTDVERSTEVSERSILDDLRWLGLDWDEGLDAGGAHGPYRQSERLPVYREHAQRLIDREQAYYCFCTQEQLEADRAQALAVGQQPKYVGRCRRLDAGESKRRVEAGESAAIRFHVPSGPDVGFRDLVRGDVQFSRDVIGDPIIVRSDGHPAYNFAVVIDDALMEITDVIRGEDHISNTPRQLLFYDALGYAPPRFSHLSLVLGPDHTPLSKRHGATSVAEFRSRGILPEALVNYLALLGWSPGENIEILAAQEMARRFAIEDVNKTAAVFDPEKLAWMNRHYLREAEPRRLAGLLVPFLRGAGFAEDLDDEGRRFVEERLVAMVAGAVNRLDEAPGRLAFLFAFDAVATANRPDIRQEFAEAPTQAVVRALVDVLGESPRLIDRDSFRAVAARVRERSGQKGRALFHPIRVALTGQADGPELDLAVPALEAGAQLPRSSGLRSIAGCRERAEAFAAAIGQGH